MNGWGGMILVVIERSRVGNNDRKGEGIVEGK